MSLLAESFRDVRRREEPSKGSPSPPRRSRSLVDPLVSHADSLGKAETLRKDREHGSPAERELPLDPELVLSALAAEGTEFLLVGGLAAVVQGAPLVTLDLDICYRRTPDNLPRLVRALAPLHPALRGADDDIPFVWDVRTLQMGCNFTLRTDGGAVDLLGQLSGVGGYEQIVERSQVLDLGGTQIRVMHLQDVIRSKEAAGRKKDLLVLDILRETLRESGGSGT